MCEVYTNSCGLFSEVEAFSKFFSHNQKTLKENSEHRYGISGYFEKLKPRENKHITKFSSFDRY